MLKSPAMIVGSSRLWRASRSVSWTACRSCAHSALNRPAPVVAMNTISPSSGGAPIKPASQLFGHWLGGSASPAALAKELNDQLLFSLGAAQLAPLEGLADLLAKLSGAVPMAVASNAPRRAVLRVLARLELTSCFSALVSADDVELPKPAAEPYRLACAALDVDPARSVAIEDSQIGAQSAEAAGMSVVKVGDVPWSTNGQVLRDPVLQVSTLSDPRLAPPLLGTFGGDKPTPRPHQKRLR